MSKHYKILKTLEKVAEAVPAIRSSRIASAITFKGQVISFGTNSMKTHPLQSRFSKEPQAICLHAEIDAIKNALRYISAKDLTKSTLYVLRYKYKDNTRKNHEWGIAKPCEGCSRAIASFGIPNVFYTLDGHEKYVST
jgi:tRNA(Arg) A34 adenosine deaminase TadA